jgi:hypothetical protein
MKELRDIALTVAFHATWWPAVAHWPMVLGSLTLAVAVACMAYNLLCAATE